MDNKRNSLILAIILTVCLLSGIKLYMEQGRIWIPVVLLAAGFVAGFGVVALLDKYDEKRNGRAEEKAAEENSDAAEDNDDDAEENCDAAEDDDESAEENGDLTEETSGEDQEQEINPSPE